MRALATLALVSAVLVACASYALVRWRLPFRPAPRALALEGEWIRAAGEPSLAASFEKRVQLPARVLRAWIAVAAHAGFQVAVDGDPIAQHYVWRPTRPFQSGLSEEGQKLGPLQPAIALNFPREYQWSGHASHRLPAFVDLTPALARGWNRISVEVESRSAPAGLWIAGEALLEGGARVSLATDGSWRAAATPPRFDDDERQASPELDSRWPVAERWEGPPGAPLALFDPDVFRAPFAGRALRAPPEAARSRIELEGEVVLSAEPEHAWLRVHANRAFDLFVGDERVRVALPRPPDLDAGDWVLGAQRAFDPTAMPELLSPHEVDVLFTGRRFERPRYGASEWRPPEDDPLAREPWLGGEGEDHWRDALRASDPTRAAQPPGARTPPALARTSENEDFVAYDVTWLLRPGVNRIRLALAPPAPGAARLWGARAALDGRVELEGGERVAFASDAGWRMRLVAPDGAPGEWTAALAGAEPAGARAALPRLAWRGHAFAGARKWTHWGAVALALGALLGLLVQALLARAMLERDGARLAARAGVLSSVLVPPAVLLLSGVLLAIAQGELSESLFWARRGSWALLLTVAAALACLAAWRALVPGAPRGLLERAPRAWRALPRTKLWRVALVLVLALAFLARAWRLEHQPLDDDEYASTQAILAIARTGVPGYVPEGVYYTRSPLYHYLTAIPVWLFGPHLWALRLPSALFGVATCWLVYAFGARLLARPWLGMAAMVLLALHPFVVFTGHVVRFYQQQQFFLCLSCYLFCRGFVVGEGLGARAGAVLALTAAVLSQEISAVMALPMVAGFLLVARPRPARELLSLALVAISCAALVVLDFAAFYVLCLTRTEGVSPIIQARMEFGFVAPYNLLALFLGYSRLHVFLSAFYFLGLWLALRRGERATLALHALLLSGVVLTNLFVSHFSLRYQYWMLPLWILLGVEGAFSGARVLARAVHGGAGTAARRRWQVAVVSTLLLAFATASFAPWRIPRSYGSKLLGDATGAFRYVSAHRRPGDLVVATEPHTHAALLEAGRVDYDLSVPLLYDFSLRQDGRLVDRNGGAEVLASLEDLRRVVEGSERVWIVVNREKLRSRGDNLRWEVPGARIEHFLRENCDLAFRTYLWSVFLWDARGGRYHGFRRAG